MRDKATIEFIEKYLSSASDYGSSSAGKRNAWNHIFQEIHKDGLILEFGAWKARSTNYFASLVPNRIVYGFDSYEGLPEDWRKAYPKGHFKIDKLPIVMDNVKLVIGFFQDTLEPFLKEHPEKVAFVHCDADLYSSTIYALNTLAKHGRLIKGTIIQFDEFFSYPKWKEKGEYKAFMEFIKTWDAHFRYYSYDHNDVAVEILEEIGKRTDIIKRIMNSVTDELVITSTGIISREVYAIKDRPENFYVQGSMGASLGIGIGLALNTKRNVLVIAGDGDILMSLGTLVLMNKLQLQNLKLIILDNNCYQSTGGQKSCSDAVDFTKICSNCKVIRVNKSETTAPRISIPHKEIMRRFYETINGM